MFPKWELLLLLKLQKEMRVIGIHILEEFKQSYSDARKSVDAWLQEAKEAVWGKFSDISNRYKTADFIQPNNVIFNLKGNKYRLWVKINYISKLVVIEKIGTHAQYMKWKVK